MITDADNSHCRRAAPCRSPRVAATRCRAASLRRCASADAYANARLPPISAPPLMPLLYAAASASFSSSIVFFVRINK